MTSRTSPPVPPSVAALAAGGAAVVGGYALYLSFPPRGWWWLAPVALALVGAAWRGRGIRAGAVLGLLAGLAFFVPLLSWTGEFVGPLPWLALAVLQASFVALAGAAVGALPTGGTWPVAAAAVWVAAEALRGRVPFGGFPWGRVAFSQPEGAFTGIAALGGAPLLSFAVALTGFAAMTAVWTGGRFRTPSAAAVALALSALIIAALEPLLVDSGHPVGQARVALIQGDVPRVGLDFNAQRRAVLDNHVRRTEELAADVAAGRAMQPDIVVWPENSADVDPLRLPDARAAVERAVRSIGVPVLVGAVLTPPGGGPTNTMIAWDPVTGPRDVHDKRRLQPFGEYMPYRNFFQLFSPLVDRASAFVPGDGDGAVRLGGIPVGVATCYEVVFDDLVRQSVRAGAELIAVPSNNATFGWTEMTFQQLAIDRVRAVEFGRTVVVPTTSGVSAVVLPDGSVESRTPQFVPAALVEDVPLLRHLTPAARYGDVTELVLVALAVVVPALRRRTVAHMRM